MLALPPQPSTTAPTITAHLLPATIHHSGPVPFHPRYWHPDLKGTPRSSSSSVQREAAASSTSTPAGAARNPSIPPHPSTAHFRGRRLRARRARLPEGYTGRVLAKTGKKLIPERRRPTAEELRRMEEGPASGDEDEEEEWKAAQEEVEVEMLVAHGGFDEVVVWGHEAVPEARDEGVLRGVEEWIAFAEAIHGYDQPAKELNSAS